MMKMRRGDVMTESHRGTSEAFVPRCTKMTVQMHEKCSRDRENRCGGSYIFPCYVSIFGEARRRARFERIEVASRVR